MPDPFARLAANLPPAPQYKRPREKREEDVEISDPDAKPLPRENPFFPKREQLEIVHDRIGRSQAQKRSAVSRLNLSELEGLLQELRRTERAFDHPFLKTRPRKHELGKIFLASTFKRYYDLKKDEKREMLRLAKLGKMRKKLASLKRKMRKKWRRNKESVYETFGTVDQIESFLVTCIKRITQLLCKQKVVKAVNELQFLLEVKQIPLSALQIANLLQRILNTMYQKPNAMLKEQQKVLQLVLHVKERFINNDALCDKKFFHLLILLELKANGFSPNVRAIIQSISEKQIELDVCLFNEMLHLVMQERQDEFDYDSDNALDLQRAKATLSFYNASELEELDNSSDSDESEASEELQHEQDSNEDDIGKLGEPNMGCNNHSILLEEPEIIDCMDQALKIIEWMKEFAVFPNVETFNLLIHGFACKLRDMEHAQQVFDKLEKLPHLTPTVSTYTHMIRGFVLSNQNKRAWEMYEKMTTVQQLKPNVEQLYWLILAKRDDLRLVESIIDQVLPLFPNVEKPTFSEWRIFEATIAATSHALDVHRSCQLVDAAYCTIPKRGSSKKGEDKKKDNEVEDKEHPLVILGNMYTSILEACLVKQDFERIDTLINQMIKRYAKPNPRTFQVLIAASNKSSTKDTSWIGDLNELDMQVSQQILNETEG